MLSAAAVRSGTTHGKDGAAGQKKKSLALAALAALVKPSVPTYLEDPLEHDSLVQSERVAVGDGQEGVVVLRWRRSSQSFGVLGEDTIPRHCTCLCPLDYHTVAVGDKFGNVAVVRLPEDASGEGEMGVSAADGVRALWEGGASGGRMKAPGLEQVCHTHLGSAVTALRPARMPGGGEVVLASTVTGGLVALQPLQTRRDIAFATTLERFLRAQRVPALSPAGRRHVAFRGAYVPVQRVVDGDYMEQVLELPAGARTALADDMGDVAGAAGATGRRVAMERKVRKLRAQVGV